MTFRGFLTRDTVGLRPPRSRSTRIEPSRGGVTGHHAGGPQKVDAALSDHPRCLALWRAYQSFHMDALGWSDIAYTFGFCQHGYLLAGRGAGVRTAANGTDDGNTRWYAGCWIGGGGEVPSGHAVDAWWTGVQMLRTHGDAGGRVNKHSDHKPTTCPGNLGPVIDAGPPEQEHTMTPEQEKRILAAIAGLPDATRDATMGAGIVTDEFGQRIPAGVVLARMYRRVGALTGIDGVDVDALAAALSEQLGDDLAGELGRRLVG